MTKTIFTALTALSLFTTACGMSDRVDGEGEQSDDIVEVDGADDADQGGVDIDGQGEDLVYVTGSGGSGGSGGSVSSGGSGGSVSTGGSGGSGTGGSGTGGDCEGGGGEGGSDEPEVEPEIDCYPVDGNPTCEDLELGDTLLRIDPVIGGAYDVDDVTVTIATDDVYVDFSTNVVVDAVIVKGGPNAMICTFSAPVSSAYDLHAPINPNNDAPYGLSHVDFCID